MKLESSGLHVKCVRCIKGYSIVVLTGTDALPLDTIRASLQRVTRQGRPLCICRELKKGDPPIWWISLLLSYGTTG